MSKQKKPPPLSDQYYDWISSSYTDKPRLDPSKKWWQFLKPNYLYFNPITKEYKSQKELNQR